MEDDHKSPSPSPSPSPSFRDRRRKSSLKISCFNRHSDPHFHSSSPSPTLKKSPSTWLRSKLRLNDLAALLDYSPGNGGKHCHTWSSGGTIINRHRRHSTTEFNYDPLSYSLNFDDDRLHTKSFVSRLPLSPPGDNKHDFPPPRIEAVEMARTDRDG